jgi:sugar phosphate isomerase/epimerase
MEFRLVNLAISNLAWDLTSDDFLNKLSRLNVTGIEVAPTKLASWDKLSQKDVLNCRLKFEEFGISIPSFQSILFGKPNLQFLGDDTNFRQLCEHINFVSGLANLAGAKILVFGAPKNRLLLNYSLDQAFDISLTRFSVLANIAYNNNVSIALEAVPSLYGSNFLLSYTDTLEIVKKVSHPGLKFHLDSGCTFLNGDDLGKAIINTNEYISHFHVSEPYLDGFTNPHDYHISAANSLRYIAYKNWICIEMLNSSGNFINIETAINYVKKNYNFD